MNSITKALIAFFVAITAIVLFLSIQIVNPGEAAIVSRFGRLDESVRTPGFYVEPFASVTYYNTKTVNYGTELAAATSDLQDINVSVVLNYEYEVSKLAEIYRTLGSPEAIRDGIILPQLAGTAKSIATKYGAEQLLQEREKVTNEIGAALTTELAKRNIRVVNLNLTNLTFASEEFNRSIDQKQIAEQSALKSKFDLERARTEAEIQRAQSESLSESYLRKLYLEKWDGKLPETLVTDGNSNLILPTK